MRSMMLGGKEHGGGRGLAINRSVSRDRPDVEASTVPSSFGSFLHNKMRKTCPCAQCVRLRSPIVQHLRSSNQCLLCFFAGAEQDQAEPRKDQARTKHEPRRVSLGAAREPSRGAGRSFGMGRCALFLSDAFAGCAVRASRLRSFRAPCRSVGGVCRNLEEPQLFEGAYV